MSTDMQQYSLESQSEAIAIYAARRGLTIVHSYEDSGRSGLRLEGRDALKRLIDDVRSKRADFKVILVYDVSRWGRFQDADESAFYEYTCKESGIAVEYCAEQFENDGSLAATVIKNIKRAMAGEYSRELSVKVHAGHMRLAALGFCRGASAGFGLRRHLVRANGERKTELARGQWKDISSDRVILVPGPPAEIATIDCIYRMFVDERLSLKAIARRLNAEGIKNVEGRPWLPTAVREVLSNEKYIGNNVYNRTSISLGSNWRRNPRSQWVVAKDAFEPIVARDVFYRAQHLLRENLTYTHNELLDHLTAVWCQQGTLSVKSLAACKYAPGSGTYFQHFGGLRNAVAMLGFVNPRARTWTNNQKLRNAMNETIIEGVRSQGGRAEFTPRNFLVRMNDELSLSTTVARLVTTENGDERWRFGCKTRNWPDLLVVARAAIGTNTLRDYFCLPYVLFSQKWLTFSERDTSGLELFQMETLTPVIELFARVPVQPTVQTRRSCVDGAIIVSTANQLTASVEQAINGLIERVRAMLADQGFAELLLSQGMRTMPRLLAVPPEEQVQHGNNVKSGVLDFAIICGFVSRLLAHAGIAARIHQTWPEFLREMRMIQLTVLAGGPRVRPPPATG